MKKSGFIRNSLIVAALAWVFICFLLPEFVRDRGLREVGRIAIVTISVWGVLTLLANRLSGPGN